MERKEIGILRKAGYTMMSENMRKGRMSKSAIWHMNHIPDYSAKPRKAKVLNYAGRILV